MKYINKLKINYIKLKVCIILFVTDSKDSWRMRDLSAYTGGGKKIIHIHRTLTHELTRKFAVSMKSIY